MTPGLPFPWTESMTFVLGSSYLYRQSNMSSWMVAVAPTLSLFGACYDVLIILLMFRTIEHRSMVLELIIYNCSSLPAKFTSVLAWLGCTDGIIQMSDSLLVLLFERKQFLAAWMLLCIC